MNITANQIAVRSYLFNAGVTEDGEAYVAETYVITVTLPDGSRYDLETAFPGVQVIEGDDGYKGFIDVREHAEGSALRLMAIIVEAGEINLDHWVEADPVYASASFEERSYYDPEWLDR